jgi:hypothetical protein
MNAKRIVINTGLSMLVVIGLWALLLTALQIGFISDHIDPTDPPAAAGENTFRFLLGGASWPFLVAADFLGKDPPGIFWVPLLIATGAFWAFALELIFALKTNRGSIGPAF